MIFVGIGNKGLQEFASANGVKMVRGTRGVTVRQDKKSPNHNPSWGKEPGSPYLSFTGFGELFLRFFEIVPDGTIITSTATYRNRGDVLQAMGRIDQ